MRRRKLVHIADIGDELIGRLDTDGARERSRVVALWPKIAGPEICSHTSGVVLKDGVLLVYVDSAAWANELSLMSENLRSRLNQEHGEEPISQLRFLVSGRSD